MKIKLLVPLVAALIAQVAVAQSGGSQPLLVNFRKHFNALDVAQYKLSVDDPSGSPHSSELIQTTVQNVSLDGATIEFKTLSFETGSKVGGPGIVPDLTSKVGPMGMPAEAPTKTAANYLVLSAAGVTLNMVSQIGLTVPVHWQSDSKDVILDGSGKLVGIDAVAKTLTVDWATILTLGKDQGAFKVTSTYSIPDFSLVSSNGKFAFSGKSFNFSVIRVPASGTPGSLAPAAVPSRASL